MTRLLDWLLACEQDERAWREDGERNGWKLPRPAAWPWRLPVIRSVRAVYYGLMVDRWYRAGPGLIGLQTGYDQWVLYAMARGWV